MKYVTMEQTEPGMILANPLYNNNASLLLSSNQKLTQPIISHLKTMDFEGLFVFNSKDSATYETLLSDDTRLNAIKNLKHLNIDSCLYVANSITNEILEKPNTKYSLSAIGNYDNVTYMHSINVAVLATMIGINMGFTNKMLQDITQAAILHDIGKTIVNPAITKKKGKLTEEEYKEMQKHTEYGLQMLRENELISSVVRNAVYSHHENEDGSGYPRGITGDKIHIVAKIIHVADVYDALTSKRSYKEELSASLAMQYMIKNIGTLFDENVVNALHDCVFEPIYEVLVEDIA